MLIIPEQIKFYLADLEISEITEAHVSGDLVYKIGEKFILKISNCPERLRREKNANDFLTGKISVSDSVCYFEQDNKAYYLKTQLSGTPLVQKKYLEKPENLAKLLAEAMRLFHSIDISNCDIFNLDSVGKCFVHGDFCLPNILAHENEIVGFIDTGSSGIGDPWVDYAWCIWSFEYNLKTKKYNDILLKELGIEFNLEKYNMYIYN